jgi:hypothetical protein
VEDVEGERTARIKVHLAVEDRLELTDDVLKKRDNVSGAQVRVLQLDRLLRLPTGRTLNAASVTERLPAGFTVQVGHALHAHETFLLLQDLEHASQRVKDLRKRFFK